MFELATSYLFLFEHPVVGLLVLAVVSAAVILVISGGRLGEALGSMFRVFVTIFTTPFVFLRDAMTAIRTSSDSEQDYQQSRVFMLFRLSRLQYLALLVFCLLILSGGITSSLLSLYPAAEIQRTEELTSEIGQLEQELASANDAAASASAPDYRQRLATHRSEARNAYVQQIQSNAAFMQSTTYSGGVITQIANASSASTVVRLRDNLVYYMQGCPRGYSWRGMSANDCVQFRAFAAELASRRLSEFELVAAAEQADRAWRQADEAAQIAAARVSEVQGRLDYTRQLKEQIAPWSPERITQRMAAAGASFLLTLWSVIMAVWLGASVISFLSWIVLMMRTLEKLASDKLAQSRPEELGAP